MSKQRDFQGREHLACEQEGPGRARTWEGQDTAESGIFLGGGSGPCSVQMGPVQGETVPESLQLDQTGSHCFLFLEQTR